LRERAAALAALIPRSRLDPAVLSWADAAGRERWGVALSGGADSVALLLLVWAHWPARRSRIVALHFDHRLRGRASAADAAFCRRLCAALGVRLIEDAWSGRRAGATEAEAREARMSFFRRRVSVLWLGHQRDDVAETMLMRLARGSGAAGLAAPRPVQPVADGRLHLRPLLTLRHAEITSALRTAGLPWREDATNATGVHLRNRVRHDVLPRWERAAGRDAAAGAARSRELLEEDDAALEAWVDALRPLDRRGRLKLTRLRGRPRAVWRRSLHRWVLANPPATTLSRAAFDALLADVVSGRPTRHSAGRDHFAVCDGRRLELKPAASSGSRRSAGRIN
jgi:tRNA(Ile)-lysidine synthase